MSTSHEQELNDSFDQVRGKIAGWAGRRGHPDPESFSQDCLIEYWRKAERENFSSIQIGLIFDLVKKRWLDYLRVRSRGENRQVFATRVAAECLENDCGESNLSCLSEKAVDILRLKHVLGWSDAENAAAMGMTVNGIRSSLKRSHRRLLDVARCAND